MSSAQSPFPGQLPPATSQQPIYHVPPPDDLPPSYDDATQSASAPLLVGPPPDYGAFRAYPEPEAEADESSEASSDIESTSRTLPEWIGQALVVLSFLFIIYCFWKLVNEPNSLKV